MCTVIVQGKHLLVRRLCHLQNLMLIRLKIQAPNKLFVSAYFLFPLKLRYIQQVHQFEQLPFPLYKNRILGILCPKNPLFRTVKRRNLVKIRTFDPLRRDLRERPKGSNMPLMIITQNMPLISELTLFHAFLELPMATVRMSAKDQLPGD